MSDDSYARLMIEALPRGGYIIVPGQMHEGEYTPIIAARTTLDAALAFVRGAILQAPGALEDTAAILADATPKSPPQREESET